MTTTTTPTITLTEDPPGVRTCDTRTSDGDTDEDDVVVVSALLRMKHRTTRTKETVRNGSLRKPSTPPRRTKTKKTALSSVISYEEATDLTGVDVQTSGVEGDDGRDGAAAGEEYRDTGEHYTNSDRTTEPTEIGLRGLYLADGPPPPSSPEEEVVASSLLALRRSTPTAPVTEAALNDSRDGLFVSQDTPTASKPTDTISRDECATTRAVDWSHQIGKPKGDAVDDERCLWLRFGHGAGKLDRLLDRRPAIAPIGFVLGNARAHLVVQR